GGAGDRAGGAQPGDRGGKAAVPADRRNAEQLQQRDDQKFGPCRRQADDGGRGGGHQQREAQQHRKSVAQPVGDDPPQNTAERANDLHGGQDRARRNEAEFQLLDQKHDQEREQAQLNGREAQGRGGERKRRPRRGARAEPGERKARRFRGRIAVGAPRGAVRLRGEREQNRGRRDDPQRRAPAEPQRGRRRQQPDRHAAERHARLLD